MLAAKLGIELQLGEQEQLRVAFEGRRQYADSPLPLVMPPEGDKLQLLTASHRSYLNSQILPGMEQGLQVIHIHPEDARKQGIEPGDRVRVTGPAGNFAADAVLTDRVVPGVVMCWKNISMREGICNNAISSKSTDTGTGLDYYSVFILIHAD